MPDPKGGFGGYKLSSPDDKALAFDYDHTGNLDHLIFYRPGNGSFTILKNNGGVFSPVFTQDEPYKGIGGYDLRDPADRVFAFDYERTGKFDHLFLYRPGTGEIFILKNVNGTFVPVYRQGAPGKGIGGYRLTNPTDLGFAFDYEGSGKLDHLIFYGPGNSTISIIKNVNGHFTPVFSSYWGIGGYDLNSTEDRIIAFDHNKTGTQDHLVFTRAGNEIIWILKHENGGISLVYQAGGAAIGGYDLKSVHDQIFALDYVSGF